MGELSRFIGDADAEHLIANAVDAACDRLEIEPPLATIRHARVLVTARHDGEWAAREQADADTLADAVEAGWLDREGNYIPERKYP